MQQTATTPRSKTIPGLIGLGHLFVWGCAVLFWIDLTSEFAAWKQVAGYVGAGLASLAGLAMAVYASTQEQRAASLEVQLKAEREAATAIRL